jgi:hypothetical protein
MGSVIRMFKTGAAMPRRRQRPRHRAEIRFRYPTHDEISEVSCHPVRREQKRAGENRRAS